MKLPRRSLAFGYAKWWLNRPPSRFAPYFLLAWALTEAVVLIAKRRFDPIDYALMPTLVGAAAQAWANRGIREVFAEQDRQLEETRTSKRG